jgi:proteasome activator subunit 3 (PA28 gamma)
MIQTTSNPNSPFHIPSSTDTTIYPPPTPISDDVTYEANVKKRKRLSEGGGSEHARVLNDSTGARSPQLVHSNSHILNVHEIIKRQCEDLVTLTVRFLIRGSFGKVYVLSFQDQVKLWVTLAIPK